MIKTRHVSALPETRAEQELSDVAKRQASHADPLPRTAQVSILATTDLHAHILGYDYFADRRADNFGLSRTARLVQACRETYENTLLVDNGDILQGTPLGDLYARETGKNHPMIMAMNALGYDAGTIGNHDFNYGLQFLQQATSSAAFPFVLANVQIVDPKTAEHGDLFPPYHILRRGIRDNSGDTHQVTFGLIGFTPPQIIQWDHKHLDGKVVAHDIVDTARRFIPQMRAEGAEVIIALCHSGLGADTHFPGMENAVLPLAALAGIDAIVAGHSHLVFPSSNHAGQPHIDVVNGRIHGTPVTLAGSRGSHLGLIQLELEHSPTGWRVTQGTGQARAICPEQAEAPLIAEVSSAAHQRTLDFIRQPVGRTSKAIHSYFAHTAPDPSMFVVAEAKRLFVEEKLAGGPLEALPLLVPTSPFKSGGRSGSDYYTDIPAGPLTIRNIADLYLYPNLLRVLRITGAMLRDWIERSASFFHQILPGAKDAELLDPYFPSYNFTVIHGMTYDIDLSQPPRFDFDGALLNKDAYRVRNMVCHGRDVADEDLFLIATNDYRASGSGNFPGASPENLVLSEEVANRDIVQDYIRKAGVISPAPPRLWSFLPMPGTSATFLTGRGALRYLPDVAGSNISLVGDGPGGFLRFRITL